MSAKINSKYLESYINEFSSKICDDYYSSRKYITGAEIIQLTPSIQVNYFIIKALFEAWQLEVEKLKNNPFFDYRDNSVHHALKEFMNVLSRSIKIERIHLEPLLQEALLNAVVLASDPLTFYVQEIESINENDINSFLKENKKYYKWHQELFTNLIDRAGLAQNLEVFKKALFANYDNLNNQLETKENLLYTLNAVAPLDIHSLFLNEFEDVNTTNETPSNILPFTETSEIEQEQPDLVDEETPKENITPLDSTSSSKRLNASKIWDRLSAENYGGHKGEPKELFENLGLNHRFMFTKELFSGNPDLLKNALKSIEKCKSFTEAIEMINDRFVIELDWQENTDAVEEFLQFIFRKFENKS